MKLIKFASIYDEVKYTISNDEWRSSIANNLIKYAVRINFVWIGISNEVSYMQSQMM